MSFPWRKRNKQRLKVDPPACPSSIRGSHFADEVAAAEGTHTGGVHSAGGNVDAVAGAEGARLTVLGKGHFAIKDDVSGKRGMGVVGVEGARAVLQSVEVGEALGAELLSLFSFLHG